MTPKKFGNEIKRLRKSQHINQQKMTKICEFRGSYIISRIEAGNYRVLTNIFKLIDKLGYDIEFKRKRM